MKRGFLATSIVAVLGGLLAVTGTARTTGGGAPAPASFRLGDGSAGCAFDGTRLACRGVGLRSAVVLEADGRTYANNAEVEWDASTPVLERSESWWHGEFSCRVDGPELVCATVSDGVLAVGTGRGPRTLPSARVP